LSGHYRNTGFYPKYSLVLTQKFTVLNTLTRFPLEPKQSYRSKWSLLFQFKLQNLHNLLLGKTNGSRKVQKSKSPKVQRYKSEKV